MRVIHALNESPVLCSKLPGNQLELVRSSDAQKYCRGETISVAHKGGETE